MGTIFDYVAWRGDISFEQVPMNEVDSLILSLLSYIDYQGIVSPNHNASPISLQAAANTFFSRNPDPRKISIGLIIPKNIIKLFRAVKETKRFRNLGLKGYVNRIDTKRQMQFSAVTFCMESGDIVVSYRGTDDTLVGWVENLNMSFMDVVPAQENAAEYLNEAGKNSAGKIYVTGHSKGGNLSVFAASHCLPDVKARLDTVWSNDGPGFRTAWLDTPEYRDIQPRIRTLVPQSSVVGMLLVHDEHYTVVKSRQLGLLQHDGLTWEVMGGSFEKLDDISDESKRTDRVLREWLDNMSLEQREQFCEAIYKLLSADNAYTLTDLMSPKNRWILRGMKLDLHVHKTLAHTLRELLRVSARMRSSAAMSEKQTDEPRKRLSGLLRAKK